MVGDKCSMLLMALILANLAFRYVFFDFLISVEDEFNVPIALSAFRDKTFLIMSVDVFF